jgi:hypothetical protein
VEDQVKQLAARLFTTEDLREVQSLAIELQRAVYEHIQRLQTKLPESSQPDGQPALESSQAATLFEHHRQKTDDQS